MMAVCFQINTVLNKSPAYPPLNPTFHLQMNFEEN